MMDRPAAIVTGGTRGIGLAIAEQLARRGFNLCLVGRRDADDVRDALDAVRAAGGDVVYVRADVGDLEAHPVILDTCVDRFGRIDCLVNNAGVGPSVRADVLEMTPESFDRVLGINLRGPFFLSQMCARRMLASPAADVAARSIINVSSVSATVVSTNRLEYCISKAGVAMATRGFAARLAPEGIGVYEVRPGVIETDMTAGVKDKYDALIADGLTVEPRWGQPDDVGRAVGVLASGELTYATGQVVMVDGGLTLERL